MDAAEAAEVSENRANLGVDVCCILATRTTSATSPHLTIAGDCVQQGTE
jgi:hypothetical protein